jgi:hypothetical protein
MNKLQHSTPKKATIPILGKKTGKLESYHLMIVGLFAGMGSVLFLSSKLLVPKLFILQVVVACCLAGLIIPMKLYDKHLGWGRIESFILNIFGIGPIICALLMWTNYLVSTETKTITYQVKSVRVISDFDAYFQLELADSAMSDFPEFREFVLTEDNRHFAKATAVQYEISTGILGYDVVKSIEVFD